MLVGQLAMALYFGPTPAEEAIARCERPARRGERAHDRGGDREHASPACSRCAGTSTRLGGSGPRRGELYEELGLRLPARRALHDPAPNRDARGRPRRCGARAALGLRDARAHGREGRAATIGCRLPGRDVLPGRDATRRRSGYAEIVTELAAADDSCPQALWRSVRAKVFARRGEPRVGGGARARGRRHTSRARTFPICRRSTSLEPRGGARLRPARRAKPNGDRERAQRSSTRGRGTLSRQRRASMVSQINADWRHEMMDRRGREWDGQVPDEFRRGGNKAVEQAEEERGDEAP